MWGEGLERIEGSRGDRVSLGGEMVRRACVGGRLCGALIFWVLEWNLGLERD